MLLAVTGGTTAAAARTTPFAPAGSPKAIVAKLHGEIAKLVAQPDVREDS